MSANSVLSSDSGKLKSKFNAVQMNSKERTYFQGRSRASRNLNFDSDTKLLLSLKDINHDSIIANKHMIEGYILESKVQPYYPSLVTRYRATEIKTMKKVMIKYSPYSLNSSPVSKFLNEWYLLSGSNPKQPRENWMDSVSNFAIEHPISLPRDMEGILYPSSFFYSEATGGSALIYDDVRGRQNLKEKLMQMKLLASPLFLAERSPSSSSLKSNPSHHSLDLSQRSDSHKSPDEIVELLEIIIKVLKILKKVHNLGYTNNGLTTLSIVIDESGDVLIEGWDFAFTRSYENCSRGYRATNKELILWLLPYTSPEATGSFNKVCDYRSDFYSLGVILYEILVGILPFESAEASKIIAAHIYQTPIAPSMINPWIPEKLSRVVMKCLEKLASNRYSDCNQIINELTQIISEMQNSPITDREYPHKVTPRFIGPKSSYNREKDLEKLIHAYENAPLGVWKIHITGEKGAGKTSLLEDFRTYLLGKRGILYAHWHHEQVRNIDSTYKIFISIIRQVLNQILALPPNSTRKWKEVIVRTIDDDLRIVQDIFPELKNLVGAKHFAIAKESKFVGENQLDVLPAKFESRFEYIIKQFFKIFATFSSQGLTIIMDDDQFQHENERYLFQEISSVMLTESKTSFRMRVVSSLLKGDGERGEYRSFETLTPKSLLESSDENTNFMELSPISQEAVEKFLADFLPALSFPVQCHISKLFYEEFLPHKTPLQMRTSLARMVFAGAFKIENDSAVFNLENAKKLLPNGDKHFHQGFIFNSIKEDDTNILKFAACICSGYSFSLFLLSVVSGLSILETYLSIFKSVTSGLVSPLGIDYKVPFHLFQTGDQLDFIPESKIIELATSCLFEFTHDTIKDYILSSAMDEMERKHYHRLCALRLYDKIDNIEDLNYSKLIYMTRHFIESTEVAKEEDIDIYGEVLISGGRFAYENYDFHLSLFYFQLAKDFVDAGCGDEELFSLSKRIDLTIVQLLFIIGSYQECIDLVDVLVPLYKSDLDKIYFMITKLKSFFALEKNEEGVTVSLYCLKLLGFDLQEDEEWNFQFLSKLQPRIPLAISEIRALSLVPGNTENPEDLIKTELIANMLFPLVGTRRNHLVRSLIYMAIIDVMDNGYLPQHALIMIMHSLLLVRESPCDSFMRAIEYTDTSLKVVQDSDASLDLGTSVYEVYCCTLAIYNEPIDVVSKYFDVFISSSRSYTDSAVDINFFLAIGIKNASMVVAGTENLNSILMRVTNMNTKAKFLSTDLTRTQSWLTLGTNFLKCLIGTLNLKDFKIQSTKGDTFLEDQYLYLYYCLKLFAAYVLGEYEIAFATLFEDLPSVQEIFTTTCYKILITFTGCLLVIKFPGETTAERQVRAEFLKENLSLMEIWTKSCPTNFETKYMLVQALVLSQTSTSSSVDVLDAFELVIERAGSKGQLLDQALAYEICSSWLLENSLTKIRASKFMKEAVRLYNLWGCAAKVSKMSEEHHQLIRNYNWAGVDVISPSTEYPSPSFSKSSAPFQLLLSSIFRGELLVTSSSDEADDTEADNEEDEGKTLTPRRSSSESSIIDMKSAMSACLAISEALDHSSILTKLVESTLSFVDGDFAVVVMKGRGGGLYLDCALSNKKVRLLDHEPLNSRNDICPITLVQDVITKGYIINREDDPIFFDNKYSDQDLYYQTNSTQVAACIPIKDQHEVIGAIYVENQSHIRSRTKCFSGEKIDIAVLFCTQLAFSLYKASMYEQMDLALSLAKAATEEKANFLNSMSHEIRTPFNSLLSCALFLLDTELTDVQRDYVETIKNSSMVTLNIIDGILSFAKIENSSVTLDEFPFSINECIESALLLVSEQAVSKNLEMVNLSSCDDVDIIYSDITRFRQVIVNLVGNALKFTESGYILVETGCQEVSTDGKYEFTITVKDTGIGIPKDSQHKVFGAFSQVDGSARRVYGGAGLGLAISKKIVDIMGGSLTFQSVENEGTTFRFSLIVKAEKRKDKHRTFGKGKRVLIVDYNRLSVLSLEKELKLFEFEVDVFESISQLIQLLKSNVYEVAFCHKRLVDNYSADEMERLIRMYPHCKFILMGPFGTIHKLSFDRCLLLPFARLKIFEIVSPKVAEKLISSNVSKHSNNTLTSDLAEKHPLTILLVEDNMINTKVTLQHLKRMGYKADHAGDGLIALDKCSEQIKNTGKNYDVVLMDIQMPNMDGIESCTKMMELYKESKFCPNVIALTANVVGEDRLRCAACGMSNFLSKPLLPNDLAQLLLHVKPLAR